MVVENIKVIHLKTFKSEKNINSLYSWYILKNVGLHHWITFFYETIFEN